MQGGEQRPTTKQGFPVRRGFTPETIKTGVHENFLHRKHVVWGSWIWPSEGQSRYLNFYLSRIPPRVPHSGKFYMNILCLPTIITQDSWNPKTKQKQQQQKSNGWIHFSFIIIFKIPEVQTHLHQNLPDREEKGGVGEREGGRKGQSLPFLQINSTPRPRAVIGLFRALHAPLKLFKWTTLRFVF